MGVQQSPGLHAVAETQRALLVLLVQVGQLLHQLITEGRVKVNIINWGERGGRHSSVNGFTVDGLLSRFSKQVGQTRDEMCIGWDRLKVKMHVFCWQAEKTQS